jgi:hypothetical protein
MPNHFNCGIAFGSGEGKRIVAGKRVEINSLKLIGLMGSECN